MKGSTAETARKRPERLWTAARTMEVLRRCPHAIAQRPVHCAIAVSTAVLDRVTKTMSVAPLLTNNLDNSKQKTCSAQLHLPTHDLFWANVRVQLHLPPLRSLDLLISPGTLFRPSAFLLILFYTTTVSSRPSPLSSDSLPQITKTKPFYSYIGRLIKPLPPIELEHTFLLYNFAPYLSSLQNPLLSSLERSN